MGIEDETTTESNPVFLPNYFQFFPNSNKLYFKSCKQIRKLTKSTKLCSLSWDFLEKTCQISSGIFLSPIPETNETLETRTTKHLNKTDFTAASSESERFKNHKQFPM